MPGVVQIFKRRPSLFQKASRLHHIVMHALRGFAQTIPEVIQMAKQGMARPDWTHPKPRNSEGPVPLIQGKAKHGKVHARPIIPGTEGPELKVYHNLNGDGSVGKPTP